MSQLTEGPASLGGRWAEAIAQIAKAEAKLILVGVCAALLYLPAMLFFSLHTGSVDVDLAVHDCKPGLAGDVENWVRAQRPGITVSVSPFPGRDGAVAATETTYHVHYIAADLALLKIRFDYLPEPFVGNCSFSGFQERWTDDAPAPWASVNAMATNLLLYAAIALVVSLSLRSRREAFVSGATFSHAIAAIPRWCVPLGVVTMLTAAGWQWLASQMSVDIGSARDLGPLGDIIKNSPWLAFGIIVIAAPICEELLFRRWLLESFVRANLPVLGTIVVSVNFAIPHLAHFAPDAVFAAAFATFFAISAVLCWVYVRTRNVFACIVVHMVHNGAALLASWLTGGSP
jgi:membrane protease YdiL (CAAX protease family)